MTENKGDVWVAAGFAELAHSGVDGVRVEVLAKKLGVTKGGFYRRFQDRAALLEAMLTRWRDGRIAAIEKQTALDGASARERLKAIITLYSERMNTEAMAIELAIRQWARTDEAAAAAAASVDAARLKNVGQLYRATGLSTEEADAQAFLFYCFIFGQSLLFLERGPRKRAQLLATIGGQAARKANGNSGQRKRPAGARARRAASAPEHKTAAGSTPAASVSAIKAAQAPFRRLLHSL